jgi:putative ABC transport system permease protein
MNLRYAIRALRSHPGLATVAIFSLALGIGANTAIFSLINSVILKTLPVSHPEQLLQVTVGDNPFFSKPVWEQLRDRQDVFSGIFAYGNGRFNLAARGEARYAQGNFVSGQFFDTLALRAIIGRTFTAADDQRGCGGTAVLSYGFWLKEYAGRNNVVGKSISLDNHPFEIVGVLGPGFTGVDVGIDSDLYVPVCAEKIVRGENTVLDRSDLVWLRIIGRPKPGISASQVDARLRILASPIFKATVPPKWKLEQQESYRKRTFNTQIAANGLSFLRQDYRQALLVLMAIAGVVLLIACANVANLLLARNAARQREVAIRMALGSGRWRLMRQLLTESLLLSLTGAALGILFAHWGARLLVGFLSLGQNRIFLDLSIDYRVLGFTAGVAILTGLLFGLAPAWKGTRVDPHSAMKANARGTIEGSKFGLGKALVVMQVALSLVLVVAAGLMLTTFFRLETLDPGFEREHVLLADVALSKGQYSPARLSAIFGEMLERLRTLPGVRSASASGETPINGEIDAGYLQFDGYTSKALVYDNSVSDRFFETLGTDLLAGRDFNSHDTPESSKVAVVNQTIVNKFFAGQNPIGKHFRPEQGDQLGAAVEIIGVVKDAKYVQLREENHPIVYLPASQNENRDEYITFEVRVAAGAPTSLIAAAKSSIADVNRDASLNFTTLALQVDESLSRERLLATLSGFFGGLALLLAMIGLYGVMSYNITRRRNEIGIRMALGAEPGRVLRMVMVEVGLLIGAGLALGLAVSLAATRLVASFLYGLTPRDPVTLSLAVGLLAVVSCLAGYLQAHRASRLEPLTALGEE